MWLVVSSTPGSPLYEAPVLPGTIKCLFTVKRYEAFHGFTLFTHMRARKREVGRGKTKLEYSRYMPGLLTSALMALEKKWP